MSKKKKQKKSIIILLSLITVIFITVIIYFILNVEDQDNNLTLIEKQWIEKNKSELIDIKIPNNINIISSNGEGILFNFIKDVETSTELQFNKVSYNYPDKQATNQLGFLVLKDTDTLQNTDYLIMEDSYLLLGAKEGFLNDLDSLNNKAIGILSSDKDIASTYFIGKTVRINTFSTIDALVKSLSEKNVDYILVPRYYALDKIVNKANIFPKYNLTDMSNKIVLRFGEETRLNNILKKYLENYKEEFDQYYEEYLMDFHYNFSNISDEEKSNLTRKVYKYGYIKNTSYNIEKSNVLYGVSAEYINTISRMANIEFEYIEYNTKADLVKDIKNKTLDIAFLNFNYDNDNYLSTSSPFTEKMAVISKGYQSITSKDGLNNNNLYLLTNNYLYDYISNNYNASIVTIKNQSTNIDKNGLMILDKNDYLYHAEDNLSQYKLLFIDEFTGNYKYIVKNNESTLYNLLNFVLQYTDYNEVEKEGMNNLVNNSEGENNFQGIYIIILLIIIVPIITASSLVFVKKRGKKLKIVKKEEILKYNDMLTSLKNRNYLNNNINKWDETKIFPRTIIIADLNNLKYVNDNYGHEEGNLLIKKAAAILINTQLEKSEIITDGNEFLIYLVGYSEKQITEYISKLSKAFESLPHGFGAAMGYSIIEDEIKTIDDAINEATIEMRMDKENNYR